MPKLAIVMAGSATPAFFAQVAVINAALRRLRWDRWSWSVHLFLGERGPDSGALLGRWLPHLPDVDVTLMASSFVEREGNWAQVDATIRHAPRDAEVVLSLDADTLPVGRLEALLDEVWARNEIAGVLAHTPFPSELPSPGIWQALAEGVTTRPLAFDHRYSLVAPEAGDEQRRAPFYLNGGVVFYAREAFARFAPRYLELRQALAARMSADDFSGQAAFTFAVSEEGLNTRALPMRWNFPNDPRAERLQADEIPHVAIHHYQHRGVFDRHRIFTSEEGWREFMALPLAGINRRFRDAVVALFGEAYPFADAQPR